MHDFMQSLQMRCPVPAHSGLSTHTTANAPMGTPMPLRWCISEIFSSSGHPASGMPKEFFLKEEFGVRSSELGETLSFSWTLNPLLQESLPCGWQIMQ